MSRSGPLSAGGIYRTWWPLALSWFMITVEQPILAAIVARVAEPKVQLAAWGMAFFLVLVLAAPSISMLSASTALSKDRVSYRLGRRYMLWLSAGLTALHAILAFTPAFDYIVIGLISAPPELVEPVRNGVRILLPIVPSLAVRRFQYGVLIRNDKARAVSLGTSMRLVFEVGVAGGVFWFTNWDGVTTASIAISAGVVFEAIYATVRVRQVVRLNLVEELTGGAPLTLMTFMRLYLPLVVTTLMQFLLQPIVSASLSRMPDSIGSLALWPVLYGTLLMINSAAIAFVEVVIVHLDRAGSIEALGRFGLGLGLSLAIVPAALALTPLGDLWFLRFGALPEELVGHAKAGLWLAIPLPALVTVTSIFQGTLISGNRTRSITEADSLALATVAVLLTLGTVLGGASCLESGGGRIPLLCGVSGVSLALAAYACGSVVRNLWMWRQTQRVYLSIRLRQARV